MSIRAGSGFQINLPSQGLMLKGFDDYLKLRLILRREKNRRTRRKTHEARERPTTTTPLTCSGGHPSSYNPVRPDLTWNSVVKGNALTASANRVQTQSPAYKCLQYTLENFAR